MFLQLERVHCDGLIILCMKSHVFSKSERIPTTNKNWAVSQCRGAYAVRSVPIEVYGVALQTPSLERTRSCGTYKICPTSSSSC